MLTPFSFSTADQNPSCRRRQRAGPSTGGDTSPAS